MNYIIKKLFNDVVNFSKMCLNVMVVMHVIFKTAILDYPSNANHIFKIKISLFFVINQYSSPYPQGENKSWLYSTVCGALKLVMIQHRK